MLLSARSLKRDPLIAKDAVILHLAQEVWIRKNRAPPQAELFTKTQVLQERLISSLRHIGGSRQWSRWGPARMPKRPFAIPGSARRRLRYIIQLIRHWNLLHRPRVQNRTRPLQMFLKGLHAGKLTVTVNALRHAIFRVLSMVETNSGGDVLFGGFMHLSTMCLHGAHAGKVHSTYRTSNTFSG